MKSACRTNRPPQMPVMVYDGDCCFCVRWIRRWRRWTGERVDYISAQDPQLRIRFPEIGLSDYEQAVHLLATDGAVYTGAEAVFRSLAAASRHPWLLHAYQRSRWFAWFAEACYRFVARHRRFFSALT